MFDDLPQQPNQTQRSQGAAKPPAPRLPKSEPEDIFDHVDPAPAGSSPPSPLPRQPMPAQKIPVGLDINQGKQKPPQLQPKDFVGAAQKAGPPSDLPLVYVPERAPSQSASTRPMVGSQESVDIFSEVDRSEPKIKGPSRPEAPSIQDPAQSLPPAQVERAGLVGDDFQKPSILKSKKFVIVFIIVIVIVIVGITSWAFVSQFSKRSVIQREIEQPATLEPLEQQQAVEQQQTQPIAPQAPIQEPDTDFDGVTDKEEGLYGTDPNKVDTDGDGLTDRDEIRTFKTDPVNNDTDGDGYLDGEEILNGYDPKGSGKLKDF